MSTLDSPMSWVPSFSNTIKYAMPEESSTLNLSLYLMSNDQLGDVLHWTRQTMALVCRLSWGGIPFVGGFWFMFLAREDQIYFRLETSLMQSYCTMEDGSIHKGYGKMFES
ncbi:unnamed protein product [Cuscuta europaea]|uniref:Uncharacterized protein n=1 Tax=Cuscuta europaea TaxID=41803 RepID=A0A9P0Z1Z4_CUSEU|nr:unnamed protein product [Cuscuta europaea]